MNFDLTEDQQAIVAAVEQIVERRRDLPVGEAAYVQDAARLEADLETGGFLDIALQEGLGPLEVVLMIEAACKAPQSANVMGRGLVAPLLTGQSAPAAVALCDGDRTRPLRFLAEGGVLMLADGGAVRIVQLEAGSVEPLSSFWAYPFGRLTAEAPAGVVLPGVSADQLRHAWRLGLTAEIVGAAEAAVSLTVDYVKQRKAFNQPLGAFQAIQHRLSECAVAIRASRSLLYWAAWSATPESAALAATYAQEAAARVVYDCQQFHGAIGLTLEYPLHYWTYRLRLLQGELGGFTAQSLAAVDLLWSDDKPIGDPLAA